MVPRFEGQSLKVGVVPFLGPVPCLAMLTKDSFSATLFLRALFIFLRLLLFYSSFIQLQNRRSLNAASFIGRGNEPVIHSTVVTLSIKCHWLSLTRHLRYHKAFVLRSTPGVPAIEAPYLLLRNK